MHRFGDRLLYSTVDRDIIGMSRSKSSDGVVDTKIWWVCQDFDSVCSTIYETDVGQDPALNKGCVTAVCPVERNAVITNAYYQYITWR